MKAFKSILSLSMVLMLTLMVAAGSFADSAPKWYLNKEYEEGDYVKFRGQIYIAIEDHDSSAAKFPGNPEYWTAYKKGAGFKKGEEPTDKKYDKDYDKDKNDDKYDDKYDDRLKRVYEEDQVKVYYTIKSYEDGEYEAIVTLYNGSDKDVEDWALTFDFDNDEVINDIEDADFDQDGDDVVITPEDDDGRIASKKKVSFELEVTLDDGVIEAIEDQINDDDDDEYEDDDDEYDYRKFKSLIDLPNDFDLELTFEAVETGAVLVIVEDPDFDDDIFEPEITIGGQEKSVDWGEEEVFEGLVVGKEYVVTADSYKEDGMLYKPVIENKKVKIDAEDIEVVIINYEEVEIDEEVGRVLVYIFKPVFDEDLFTPEVTIDGETEDIDWGSHEYFEDLVADESYEVEATTFEKDGKTYKPVYNIDEVEVKEEKTSYVLIKYVVED